MVKKLFATAFLVILISGSIKYVYAQSSGDTTGVSISPVIFELNADPGDSLKNQLKIFNPTDNATTVKMSVEDFVPVGEEGNVSLQEPDPDNKTFSIAFWTTLSDKEFVLEPKQQKIIDFTINLPADAEPGGHYGSIVATTSGGTSQNTGSAVSTKRGALVLLRVSGNIREQIDVDTFFTDKLQEKGPIDFNLKFINKGNVHLRPAGFITITDTFGKQVAQIEITQNNVIPNSVRDFSTQWSEKRLMGKYTATLVANYGKESKKVITQVITFTVFPWKLALIIAAILAVFIAIVYKYNKRIKLAAKVLLGKAK